MFIYSYNCRFIIAFSRNIDYSVDGRGGRIFSKNCNLLQQLDKENKFHGLIRFHSAKDLANDFWELFEFKGSHDWTSNQFLICSKQFWLVNNIIIYTTRKNPHSLCSTCVFWIRFCLAQAFSRFLPPSEINYFEIIKFSI